MNFPAFLLLATGTAFIYFVLLLRLPTHPVPNLRFASRILFPALDRRFDERVVGFALLDSDRLHVGFLGPAEAADGNEVAVIQDYVVSLSGPRNASGIQAQRLQQRTVPGTVTQTPFNRLAKPAALLGIVYRQVQDENLSYHAEITAITFPNVSKEVTGDSQQLPVRSWRLPGNLPVMRAAIGATGTVIASRRYDHALFRVYDLSNCQPGDSCLQTESLAGPPAASAQNRHLFAVELFHPKSYPSVFFVSYNEHEDYFDVSMAIFTLVDGTWIKDEIWRRPYIHYQRNVYSPVLGHEVMEAENVDQLFWLTKPIVASSQDSKTLAWIFRGRIFTLDYVDETVSGKVHGYILDDTRTISELSSSDLRVNGAALNADGSIFSVVNENDDIITFSRGAGSASDQHGDKPAAAATSPSWWDEFFSIPHEVSFFFDGNLESTPMRAKASGRTGATLSRPRWELKNMWLNEIDGMAPGRAVRAFTLLHGSQLPVSIAPTGDGHFVVVLYDNAVLNIIDVEGEQQGSHVGRFLWNRWPMIVAMIAVIMAFVVNELTGALARHSSFLVAGLSFWVLLSLLVTDD